MKKTLKQKQLEEKINKILHDDWNPIGISDLPFDEYSRYVPRIYEALYENCDVLFLTQMLIHVSSNIVGVEDDWYETLKVAEKLIIELQKDIVELKHEFYQDRMRRLDKKRGIKSTKKNFVFAPYERKIPGNLYR